METRLRVFVVLAPARIRPEAATGAAAGHSVTVDFGIWLGGRDSNPDSLVQSQLSYH